MAGIPFHTGDSPMKTWILPLAPLPLALLLVAPAAVAQQAQQAPDIPHMQHVHPGSGGDAAQSGHARSPYSGMQQRGIKALSEQQIAELRAGKGMALALPAELNGYPGPAHVLELAGPLGLSADQQRATLALFEQMQAEAKALGEQVILEERALDRLFRNRRADSASVREATARAARRLGELRAAHLDYHLRMMAVLTPRQVARYMELRGYR
jgi:hypothetical protein